MSARTLILHNRDFACVWLGQVASQSGTRMYQIALLWWLLESTPAQAHGIAVGTFMVIAALPSVTLARFIGQVIDRGASRRIMVTAELVAGVVVASIGVLLATSLLAVWMVYLGGLVVAVCQAFVDPTLTKSVPELVQPADVEAAIAFETSTQSVANFAGAVFGAMLIDRIGFAGVVFVNAASYLASAAFVAVARFRFAAATGDTSGTAEASQGRRLLDSMPFIKRVLVVFGAANFFATPTLLVLPLYTKTVLHADASVLGALEACLWVGLLVGAFSSRFFASTIRITVLGGVCLLGFAAALMIPGVIVSKPIYMAALFAGGWCLGLNNVKFVALFQAEVPDAFKGRFFALMQALLGFTFPVAYGLFGVLSGVVGAQVSCVVQSIGLACVAVLLLVSRPPAVAWAPVRQ